MQKLSAAATSGKINGSQLYEILLRETMLHERVLAESQNKNEQEAAVIEEIKEDDKEPINSDDKKMMYFGESPIEYTPHSGQSPDQ